MAVDANVLVFERIREELRAGRTVRSAIDLGFERAFTSIIDTHVTTLISALFLFQFGTGPIKGFAVTLTIGLLASLFTAVFVSRWIFDLVLSRRKVRRCRSEASGAQARTSRGSIRSAACGCWATPTSTS